MGPSQVGGSRRSESASGGPTRGPFPKEDDPMKARDVNGRVILAIDTGESLKDVVVRMHNHVVGSLAVYRGGETPHSSLPRRRRLERRGSGIRGPRWCSCC